MLKPTGDKILVSVIEETENSKSGIVIVNFSEEVYKQAKVVASGKDVMEIKIDDKIIISKHAGQMIEHDGNKYILMREQDVYAVI